MQLYFNGKPMGDVSDFTYEIDSAKYAEERATIQSSESYSATADMIVPAATFDFLFPREPAGASHATLVKRMRYGGRKGRSARRRLLARALPMNLNAGHLRYRGKATFLDEGEILMTVKSVGFRT